MLAQLNSAMEWTNANEGVLAVGLFGLTVVLGWASGIFSSLRRKPQLRLRLIEGPSFVCTYGTGAKYDSYDVHRTGIALYLHIANVGSAPTSIDAISVGYRWAILPFRSLWWRYGVRRFWLKEQTVALEDFQVAIGDNIKFYPFLTQRSSVSGDTGDSFLEVGKSTNGVIYFEQSDSWGACFPVSVGHVVRLKVCVTDIFERRYCQVFKLKRVTLEEARKYNPSFGRTLSTLHAGQEPIDLPRDANGNLLPPEGNG